MEIEYSGYIICEKENKIVSILYGDWYVDFGNDDGSDTYEAEPSYFKITKLILGAQYLPEDENKVGDIIFEGERYSGSWFDEFRVVSRIDKLFKLLFEGDNATIYRYYKI